MRAVPRLALPAMAALLLQNAVQAFSLSLPMHLLVGVAGISSIPGALSASEASEINVVDLDESNFDQIVGSDPGTAYFVMFHVSWCGICKKTLPHFIEATKAKYALGANTTTDAATGGYDKIVYGHYDATDDKAVVRRFGIRGYPSILYWDAGAAIDKESSREFRGTRNAVGFHRYIEKMNRKPVVQPVSDFSQLQESMKNEPFTGYVYVSKTGDVESVPAAVEKFAKNKRDLHTFYVAKPGLIPNEMDKPGLYGVTADHHHISKQVEVVPFPTSSESDYEAIESHFTLTKFPGVWQISDQNFYEFTHSDGVPTISVILDLTTPKKSPDDPETRVLVKNNAKVLEDVKANLANRGFHVGIIDGVAWSESLKDFSVFKHELPRVLITTDDFKQWYEDRDLLSLEAVLDVAKDLKDGKVAAYKGLPAHEGLKKALLEDYIGGSFLIYGQARNQYSKAMWYVREFARVILDWYAYAQTGPVPMAAFSVVAIGVVAAIIFAMYVSFLIVKAVVTSFFESDDEDGSVSGSATDSDAGAAKDTPGTKKTQ